MSSSSAIKPPDFLVHEDGDSVGVVVVEGIQAGAEISGWVMAQDRTITIKVLDAIPIGHKVALADLPAGSGVIKYGVDIGKVVTPICRGQHVHVHNLKTRRW
jgi:(2R)-sulfolactate sulfo-lyase subunit alpha